MSRLQLIASRLALGCVLVAATLGAAAPSSAQAPGAAAPANQGAAVLVGLRPGTSLRVDGHGVTASDTGLARSVADLGVQSADNVFHAVRGNGQVSLPGLSSAIDLRAVYKLRLPPGAGLSAALATLRADPAVVNAEPDAVAHLITSPNDPLYPQQWGLAQIGAPAAWDVTTGSSSVAIAIIDSGLDATHPDLAGQLWTNPGEIAGNGQDDDNDGFVDDLHGWNILNNNADLSDDNGHGTEVAGIAAAATNNGAGIAGVCWACKLMVVKVAQPSGVANYSDIAAGVAYAAQKGARVINLSLGGSSDSITLRAAVTAAAQTAVVVGGAGNNNSSAPFYPAAYPDALAVAGATSSDTKVADSNFGAWVDVTAPGEAITTTFSGGSYGSSSGTSLAAPFAAGLAGLLFSQHPDWSAAQVRAQIIHTAHDVDAQNPSYAGQLGSGRIDAARAVTTAATPLIQFDSYSADGQANGALTTGASVTLAVTLHNDWAAAGSVSATLVSVDSHVAVTKSSANWGALASGQAADNTADPFQLTVQASAFGLNVPFTLSLLADGIPTALHFTATTQSSVQPASGLIVKDTVWTNDRVWQVLGSVSVNSGVTLTIQPGTVVKFNTDRALIVNGTLIADGTPARPIVFTSAAANPAPGDWGTYTSYVYGGVIFGQSSQPATFDSGGNYIGGSVIRNARVEYGDGIGIYASSPFIDHNLIWNNGGSAMRTIDYLSDGHDTQPVISANRIISNVGNVVLDMINGGSAIMRGNLIANNTNTMYMFGGGGSVFSNTITNNGTGTWYLCPEGTICIDMPYSSFSFHHNVYGNASQNALALGPSTAGAVVSGTENYWGTSDSAVVRSKIYDSSRDGTVGTFNTDPILTQPESTAPSFLSQATSTPLSPLGLQHVTFNLKFSAPMDQSLNPTVAFGSASPYNVYPVVDDAAWLDATHWQATYDFTSLVPKGAYTLSVSGAQGADGMEIPTDTRFGFTVDYAGTVTDQTPPPMPWIFADGVTGNAGTVTARWSATDPNSPILHYRYAIGSARGAVDVVNWTTINTTSVTRTGLGLVSGKHYWVSVQAQNQGGLWSPVGASQFTAGAQNPRVWLPVLRR